MSLNGKMVPYVLETTVEGLAIAQGEHRERGSEPQADDSLFVGPKAR